MKNETFLYLLEGSLWMALAASIYFLLLRPKASYSFRRFYLLGASLACWLLPLLELPSDFFPATFPGLDLDAVAINVEQGIDSRGMLNVLKIVAGIYVLGVLLAGSKLLYHCWQYQRLRQKFSLVKKHKDYHLYHTHGHLPTSSFFKSLFWNDEDEHSEKEIGLIMKHEIAHIRGLHSLDRLWIEICLVFLWFHPFIYLLKYEMIRVHEFLADQGAAENENPKFYQRLLLQKALSTKLPLLHTFYSMPIGQRIRELGKKRNPSHPAPLLLLILGCVLLGMGFQQGNFYPNSSDYIEATEVAEPLNLREIKREIGYPRFASENAIQGLVVYRLLIDKKGQVKDHILMHEDHDILSKAVENQLQELRFKPAQKDGKAISMWINIPFNFKLID